MRTQGALARLAIFISIFAPAAGAEPLPVGLFAREDAFTNIKLSTDGRFLAAVVGNGRRERLAFIDLEDNRVTNTVKNPGGDSIFDFAWVSPRRVVIIPELPRSERVQPSPRGDLYTAVRDRPRVALSLVAAEDGQGESLLLTPPAELVSTLKGRDDGFVLASIHPRRSRVRRLPYYTPMVSIAKPYWIKLDLQNSTGEKSETIPLVGARVLSDHQHEVRVAIGYDRDAAFVVMWRPTVEADWETFELPGFWDGSISVPRFTVDDRGLLFTAVREGEARNALYSLDLASHSVEKLYQHAKADIAEMIIDPQNDAVAGVLVHGDQPEYHWLDAESVTAQLYQMLQRRFPGQRVQITSTSEDGSKALLLVSSDINPGDYYLLDVPRRQVDFLMAARKWLDPAQMQAKQGVQIAARDGSMLHGYVTRPGASKDALPMVVVPHDGLPGARDSLGFDTQVQMLASRGYAVLQVNFRGSGGYGADFEAAGHRQWGARMQDDITDATRWAIEQGIAAADRICIYGVGYGGYAALMGAVREPQLYRCAVGYSGIYDLDLLVRDEKLSDYRRGIQRFDELYFGRDVVTLRQRSPVYNASRIQVPVLLMHGKKDRRADLDQALRMKSALKRGNKSHEMVVLDHSGPDAEERSRLAAYETLLAFLERHLAAPAPMAD